MNEDGGGPWGGGRDGGEGPRNPWGGGATPPRRRPGGVTKGPPAIEALLRRGREQFGGGLPTPGGRPIWFWAIAAFIVLWVLTTSIHRIEPQERGVVTRLGRYASTLDPGMSITFPAPIDQVRKLPVEDIRTIDIGSSDDRAQNLMLTGDQNIIDLAYSVRWKIRDPELYLYELAEPEDTISEVAESAMRAEVSNVSLDDAIGPQRGEIADRVRTRMQELLDSYHAGVSVMGVAIKQADPPEAVNDAFKEVSAAQQDAQRFLNDARAYAQTLTARAQGDAAQFDAVFAQYRLAPEVTRRRMYYETMEGVLAKVDKTIVDAPGVTPYLPIPAVRRPTATPDAAQ